MGWGANALKSWKVGRGQKKVEKPCVTHYIQNINMTLKSYNYDCTNCVEESTRKIS